MADYGRERMYRTRAVREEPQRDAVTSVLTAQVMLCIILAIALLLVKKFDNVDYVEIKRQYGVMLSASAKITGLTEVLGENSRLAGLVTWLDKFSNELRPITADKDATESEADAVLETEAEPVPEYEPEYETDEADALPQMNFDYLKENTSLKYVSAQGGMLPSDEKDTGEMLSPPKGSTLAPVYVSADVQPPVSGIITSGFSYRYHPLTGNSDFHTGLDIAAASGTPILAALPGEVVETGYSEIYGNYIVLQHADGLKTSYSHCSELVASEGMAVRQGERIALVGETGTVTGPHLHFSVIVNGEFTNPSWVLGDYIKLVEQ